MREHPRAAILRAIADGKTIQWNGVDQSAEGALRRLANGDIQLNIKPATIRIGRIDVPEPLRVAPAPHTLVWFPALDARSAVDCREWSAHDSEYGRRALSRGLLHLTREAAELHAKALLSLTATPVLDGGK